MRKAMAPEAKRRSYVKHLPAWPYFELVERLDNNTTHVTKHSFSKSDIALASLSELTDQIDTLDFTMPPLPSIAPT